MEKNGDIAISENVSGNMPFTDLTSNQFMDGIRKIFELEPFIKVHSITTNRPGEKFIQEVEYDSRQALDAHADYDESKDR